MIWNHERYAKYCLSFWVTIEWKKCPEREMRVGFERSSMSIMYVSDWILLKKDWFQVWYWRQIGRIIPNNKYGCYEIMITMECLLLWVITEWDKCQSLETRIIFECRKVHGIYLSDCIFTERVWFQDWYWIDMGIIITNYKDSCCEILSSTVYLYCQETAWWEKCLAQEMRIELYFGKLSVIDVSNWIFLEWIWYQVWNWRYTGRIIMNNKGGWC